MQGELPADAMQTVESSQLKHLVLGLDACEDGLNELADSVRESEVAGHGMNAVDFDQAKRTAAKLLAHALRWFGLMRVARAAPSLSLGLTEARLSLAARAIASCEASSLPLAQVLQSAAHLVQA